MKKLIVLALLLAPISAFASFDTNLTYGSHGDSVTELQEFLTDQKVYNGPITGNFYSLTLAAVKLFQSKEGITPVSGYVGPITRGVISDILSAPDSEGNAATTTPPVNLSTLPPSVPQTPVYTPPVPVQSNTGGIVTSNPQPMPTETQLLPPYATLPFDSYTQWPVSIGLDPANPTSVTFSLQRDSNNWGDIVFLGQKILTKQGNVFPINYEGEVFPINSRSWFEVDGLTTYTQYSYQFIYHEDGREDTVVTKTFTTKAAIVANDNASAIVALQQQIADRNMKLIKDVGNVRSQPIGEGDQNGKVQLLVNEATADIQILQAKIDNLR